MSYESMLVLPGFKSTNNSPAEPSKHLHSHHLHSPLANRLKQWAVPVLHIASSLDVWSASILALRIFDFQIRLFFGTLRPDGEPSSRFSGKELRGVSAGEFPINFSPPSATALTRESLWNTDDISPTWMIVGDWWWAQSLGFPVLFRFNSSVLGVFSEGATKEATVSHFEEAKHKTQKMWCHWHHVHCLDREQCDNVWENMTQKSHC